MRTDVDRFLQALAIEKGFSGNTISAYRNDLYQLADFVLHKDNIVSCRDVTPELLAQYVLSQQDRGYSRATRARKIASLKSFFEFMAKEGSIVQNPAHDISSPKLGRRLPHPMSEDDATKLLTEASNGGGPEGLRDRALLELLYATGMRVSELVNQNVDQLHLVEGDGYVRCFGKGSKERVVQMHNDAVKTLKAYIEQGRPQLVKNPNENALFVNRRGERLTRQGCWLLLKEHAKRAGISSAISPHTLRHSFATHMLRGGATLRQVQEWLGHASITTTQVYTLLTDQHVRDEYDKAHPRAV
ncbi:MAG: site-specific tyrosine recombinase XerD [Dehalococcoidia bacterium]|nr:site-specific tyrosine recombinase XerD [Dehalococcoidia bacterium]